MKCLTVLRLFRLQPDYDLNIMRPEQGLTEITSRILQGMKTVLADFQPDVVLVHGDTTTLPPASPRFTIRFRWATLRRVCGPVT